MKNNKDIRVAITYLLLMLVCFFISYRFLFSIDTEGIWQAPIVVFFICVIMFSFICLPLSIYHISRARSCRKMLKLEHLIEWEIPSSKRWKEFIKEESFFRIKAEFKSLFRSFLKYFAIFMLAVIVMLIADFGKTRILVFILIFLYVFGFLFLFKILKYLEFYIENTLLKKNKIIGTIEGLVLNGEYHFWHKPYQYFIDASLQEDSKIFIEYMIDAKEDERKKISILVPENSKMEAEKYIEALKQKYIKKDNLSSYDNNDVATD